MASPAADMARHIAWDVGAAGLARGLGRHLDSPVILSDFSRLVIDPNRGEDDPTLVMKLYDGTIIPANRHVGAGRGRSSGWTAFIAPITPPMPGLPRCAPTGDRGGAFLHPLPARAARRGPGMWGCCIRIWTSGFSKPLIARLQAETDLCIGDNEPYSGHLPGDAIDRHALRLGRHNTLIELRNDLIGDRGAAGPLGRPPWPRS